jgi:hypothetical protein
VQADSHGPHAAAIILSGADGDGAIGIKRIKERGGVTIAQDLEEAEHHGMPQSAIATGMVDWVLRVAKTSFGYFPLSAAASWITFSGLFGVGRRGQPALSRDGQETSHLCATARFTRRGCPCP